MEGAGMLRGIYGVAGALEMAARNQDIVAENLSNATTPGYRRHAHLFEAPDLSSSNAEGMAVLGTDPSSFTHHTPGPIEFTQNPLDVAITGDAFFVVEGPNGPLYTRNGGFTMTSTGQLQTRSGGYPVRGQGGPLTIPPTAVRIVISPDGLVSADNAEIGRLDLARFARPDSLRRVGGTLFEGEGAETPPPGNASVQQGYREGSNVQAMQEMVSMILGMRFYEAAERAMKSLSDAVSQNTRPQA
jgi:flagellar basal-body rod protein FlgF